MATLLQVSEWLEGQPAGKVNTPTPVDPSRPALKPSLSDLPHSLRQGLISARSLADSQAAQKAQGAQGIQAYETQQLPIALPSADRLLGGGLARGELTECIGRSTSGRFSLVLAALAAATAIGEATALVDLGNSFDPQAGEMAGIALERMLWARTNNLRQTLASTEMLITGGFTLVVVDLGPPPIAGGRGRGSAWLRLARAARDNDVALLVSSPYRVAPSATTVVRSTSRRGAWSVDAAFGSPLLRGIESQIALERSRSRTLGNEYLSLHAPDALSALAAVADHRSNGLDVISEEVAEATEAVEAAERHSEFPRVSSSKPRTDLVVHDSESAIARAASARRSSQASGALSIAGNSRRTDRVRRVRRAVGG